MPASKAKNTRAKKTAANDSFKSNQQSGFNFASFNFGQLAEELMSLILGFKDSGLGGGKARARGEVEKLLARVLGKNFVTQQEFTVVRQMAIAARTQAEETAELVAAVRGSKPMAKKSGQKTMKRSK